jgi:hypothetical protein
MLLLMGQARCSLVGVNAGAVVLWAMYVNILRACWDTILCAVNGTAKQVRCVMWAVVSSSGEIPAVGTQVIGETVPGVLF